MKVSLFTTAGCHLCEDALDLLLALSQERPVDFDSIDIAGSDELMQRYGVRIPVIAVENRENDLGWPFTLDQLRQFLED